MSYEPLYMGGDHEKNGWQEGLDTSRDRHVFSFRYE